MSHSVPQHRPSLKVPKENNRFLCWPPASDSKQLLQRNQVILLHRTLPVWFRELRTLARVQALAASKAYMSSYAPSVAELISIGDLNEKPWIVGGHQPELFHPGVWFKNFLMFEIGKQTDSIGMQVIVDHDVARSDSLRVPYRQSPNPLTPSTNFSRQPEAQLGQRSIPIPMRGELQPRMPWHATLTRHVEIESWKRTLANIQKSAISCGLAEPLICRHQELLMDCINAHQNIGDAFSEFRHRIEMAHGVFNLEVPLGHLCSDSAFGLFVQHCVRNAESLWNSYNGCRDAYRSRHRIRNQGQPVLELLRNGNSFELPFWIYLKDQAVVERKRMWVSPLPNNQMLLCDHAQPDLATVSAILPLAESDLAEAWSKIAGRGVCIRPRALMTTMYLRCFVADLFVHGIGGGTYDELTDDIIQDWMGVDAPVYLTSSASLHLSLRANQSSEQLEPTAGGSSVERELQLMRSVPERYLDHAIDTQRILAETHSQKIASIPVRGKKLAWHKEISQLKQKIEIAIEPRKRAALLKLETAHHELQQRKIASSREYSFVLFEEQDVVERLSKLASAAFHNPIDSGK